MSSKNKTFKIINTKDSEVLASEVLLANTFWLRLRGLLGRDKIQEEEALILFPCSEIHCYGMKFEIDVLFLDKEKKVISYFDNLVPGSRARAKEAKYVIELQGGIRKKKQVNIDDILVFE